MEPHPPFIRTRCRAALCLAAALASAPALAASVDFQTAVSDSGPVLWYQFNESSGVAVNHGSLGSSFDATYFGTPFRNVPTASGDGAVRFDSEDDYLESASVAPAGLGGNPTFTAEAVVFVTPNGTASLWAPLLHWGGGGGDGTMKSVYFSFSNGDPKEIFGGFFNGGLQTVNDVPRGQWHHVVWVRQGGGLANAGSTIYIDGAAVALEDDPDLPSDSGTPNVVNTEFRIDRARDATRFFTGSLDELALYDRALTAQDVADHFSMLVDCDAAKCLDFDGSCRGCGQPATNGKSPLASDALAVLKRAVGSRDCNLCVCDVDSSNSVFASDALLTLKKAVGQQVALQCPAP